MGTRPTISVRIEKFLNSVMEATSTEEGPRPKKKRKKDIDEDIPVEPDPKISICLTDDDATKLGLQDTNFLAVNLEYVTWNADKSSYLYLICAIIFEVSSRHLTLLKSPVRECPPEDSDIWQPVEV